MSYKELIRNWHTKASEEDYFSKFVFEYLAFIAYLKTQRYRNSDTDRSAIQQLKADNGLKQKYISLINTKRVLKEDWEHIKEELDNIRLGNASRDMNNVEEIKWWNCPHLDLNQMTTDEKVKTKGVIHSLTNWQNMVEFWHSIRNNLFHGAKDPEQRRDKLVVKYGYRTLKELVEILINETN